MLFCKHVRLSCVINAYLLTKTNPAFERTKSGAKVEARQNSGGGSMAPFACVQTAASVTYSFSCNAFLWRSRDLRSTTSVTVGCALGIDRISHRVRNKVIDLHRVTIDPSEITNAPPQSLARVLALCVDLTSFHSVYRCTQYLNNLQNIYFY